MFKLRVVIDEISNFGGYCCKGMEVPSFTTLRVPVRTTLCAVIRFENLLILAMYKLGLSKHAAVKAENITNLIFFLMLLKVLRKTES